MKRIKQLKDLQVMKMELRIKQLEQERKISNNWNELKEDLKPRNIIKEAFADNTSAKASNEDLFSSVLGYGAGLLTRKFKGIAGQKIEGLIDKLFSKLKPRHQKN